MSYLKIITEPNDILHSTTIPIEFFDQNTRTLLHEMAETMYATVTGTGLAAPQIGSNKQAIVVDIGEGIIKLINPIVVESTGRQNSIETCLSIPGKCGHTTRPEKITVSGQDEEGKKILIHADGKLAAALCHEIDHLNGILFTDIANEVTDTPLQ